MTALATLSDFTARYEGTVTSPEEPRVLALLDDASATVRDHVGQVFSVVTDDVVTLRGNGERYVRLPQRPVTGVSLVQLNGRTLQDVHWDGIDSLWRPGGWGPYRRLENGLGYDGGDLLNDGVEAGASDLYADLPAAITVTYTHGYETIPGLVVKIVCALARREFVNPDGLRQERIGDYSYRTDGPADGSSMYLTESEVKSLERYKRHSASLRLR